MSDLDGSSSSSIFRLIPAILWARRYEARVGVATYTRALQEQAMDGEVPTALAALARAGVLMALMRRCWSH